MSAVPYRDVGRVRIHRVVEMEVARFPREDFFPGVTRAEWDRHRSWLQSRGWDPVSDDLGFCVQSFLLVTPTRTVVVDTCVGDNKKRWRADWSMTTAGVFLRRLGEVGVSPEQVDEVVCTHMHADHVGWNTRLHDGAWVPTFPNARYLLAEREWLSWKERHRSTPVDQIADSVLPILEAGRGHLIDGEFQVTDEVRLMPTAGHTPGHMSVHVVSERAEAIVTGDVIHHPVQCREPGWISSTDLDPDLALRTRRELLDACSRQGILLCAGHFPSPSFGHVVRTSDGYDFVFDEPDGRH